MEGSCLLFHAIHSPFYGGISKDNKLFSGFKNLYKKIRETRKTWVYSWIAFCRTENASRKQTKTKVCKDSSLRPEASTKNAVQEFQLRIRIDIWLSWTLIRSPETVKMTKSHEKLLSLRRFGMF